MTVYDVAALTTVRTFSSALALGLRVAQSLGIDTTTWRTGDPTKSTYSYLAEGLSTHDGMIADFIKASWLSTAEGDWLTILAREVYGIERTAASFASCTVEIKNNGGGFYPISAGDLTFKNTTSDRTYHNINNEPTLSAGMQLTIEVVADEAGSNSSAGANEIDSLVTTKLGVDIISSTTAVGIDEQSDESLRTRCRASRGALSANGPADAYNYVVTSSALTGRLDITRAVTESNSGTLTVTVYVAGAAGPVSGGSVTAAQAAVEAWATPLCVTPTVVNAIADTINVSASVKARPGTSLPSDTRAQIAVALGALFQTFAIGKGSGYDVDPTAITANMRATLPAIDLISPYLPNTLTRIAAGHVPVLGSVAIVVL